MIFLIHFTVGMDFNKLDYGIIYGIIFATLLANAFSVVLINLAQIGISVVAYFSRLISKYINTYGHFVEKSNIASSPFTFIGVVLGVFFRTIFLKSLFALNLI